MKEESYINSEQIKRIFEREYPTKEELIEAIDDLMYSLFYINIDSISMRKIRDSAFLLKILKDSLESDE